MPLEKTEAAKLLTEVVLLTFRLERGFINAADAISAPAGLGAARWKVLGAVLYEPRTVSEIGRVMGLSRQAVQRLANVLVEDGLCAFQNNPAHKSAKLLDKTPAGRAAVDQIADRQTVWSNGVSDGLAAARLAECRGILRELIDRVENAPFDEAASKGH